MEIAYIIKSIITPPNKNALITDWCIQILPGRQKNNILRCILFIMTDFVFVNSRGCENLQKYAKIMAERGRGPEKSNNTLTLLKGLFKIFNITPLGVQREGHGCI